MNTIAQIIYDNYKGEIPAEFSAKTKKEREDMIRAKIFEVMGLDGYILTAFILGIPANEIVLPIILMCYLKSGTLVNIEDTIQIGQILIQNGWTMLTAMNVMLFIILHFPCTTTLLTVKKETGSWKWTTISFAIPTICGIVLCMLTNLVYNVILVL